MSDMPERIWLDWPGAKNGEPIYTEPPQRDTQAGQTEYVRADIVQALTAERDRLRALLAEADRRIAWEAHGFGNDFAERVEAALKGESHD